MQANVNSNNAQGVVPGYQPLRSNAQRSNTAGKHSAQQQLNPHPASSGGLPTTASGQRPTHASLKYKKGQQENLKGTSMIGQQHVPHSNHNLQDPFPSSGQVLEKSSKPLDLRDQQLKKSTTINQQGQSPRPGGGQVQIQQVIRNHYQGNSGNINPQQSSKSRPLRTSRQQISPSIVNQLQVNPGQSRSNQQPFDGQNNAFNKGGSHSSRLPTTHVAQQSLGQNQTPKISNFHPPAIQKHESISGAGPNNSRRNNRQAQINKNHPELVVQNSQSQQNSISYSYSKRSNNAVSQSQQMANQNFNNAQVANAQQHHDSQKQHGSGKFVRPNTASETRKFMQQQLQQENQVSNTVGSPMIQSRQGLVPQPAAMTLNQSQDATILATSAKSRRNAGNSGTPGQHGYPTPTNQVNQLQQRNNNDKQQMNQLSISHDHPLRHPRAAKEDTLFPDKKGKNTQGQGGHINQLNLQQPQLNTIGAGFGAGGGGQTDRGAQSSRIPISQTLEAYSRVPGQGQGPSANSTSHISPLLSHQQAPQTSHQRITSQQNQQIPQYHPRKANLRDLRKSQRLSNQQQQQQPKDKKFYDDTQPQNSINPLTSLELNQHFAGRKTHGGSSSQNKAATGQKNSNHQAFENSGSNFKNSARHKETNRSLDPKRQLLIPNNSGMGGTSQQDKSFMNPGLMMGHQLGNVAVNKSQNAQSSLVPSGYKRRTKRPGQSLNQISLQYTNQANLNGSFPDDSQKEQLNNINNSVNGSLTQRNKRLELNAINNIHQRGGVQDALSSDRNKHSRQKNMLTNSVDGAIPRRIPSVHSVSHKDDTDHDKEPSKSNETPKKVSAKQEQQVNADGAAGAQGKNSERFNAITKFAFATSCGHQPGNPYKVNQDTYTLAPNMCGQQGFHLFVVCDGHGVNGHKASGDIKLELPKELEMRLQADQDFLENKGSREFSERIPRYFRDAFDKIHDNLMNNKNYDCNLSGSTVTAVLFDSLRIYCANAGDSRAVLYTQGKKGGLKVTPLSEDHKPCLPKERARIEKVGGRVNPIIGPQGQHLGPERVWMLHEDTPGLAMSRSLGDGLAHSLGVSWEPEVKQLVLEPSDKFIVIASDGVWEFLSNEQIARIVWPYYIKNSPEQAGNAIVRASAQKWKENDTVIDDITCITIFLEVD